MPETSVKGIGHENILQRIVTESLRFLKADRSAIFFLNPSTNNLRVEASVGLSNRYVQAVCKMWRESPIGRILDEQRLCVSEDVLSDPRFEPLWNTIQKEGFRSCVIIPLISDGKSVGTLNFYFDEIRRITPEEMETVQTFGDMTAIAIENAKMVSELEEKSAQIAELNAITRDLASRVSLDEILEHILEASKQMVGGHYAVFYLYDETQELLIPHERSLQRFAGGTLFPSFPIGKGLAGWVGELREPLLVPAAQRHPKWVVAPWNKNLRLGAFAGLPLISRGNLLGVLGFYASLEDGLSEEGFELLKTFADQAAVAVDKARLLEEARERATALEIQDGISKAINSTLELEDLFRLTIEQVKRMVPCMRASLFTLDAEKKTFDRTFVLDDLKKREHFLPSMNVEESHLQQIVETQKPLYIPDARKDPYISRKRMAEAGFRSIINVPILSEGECIGFLNVCSTELNAFADYHVRLLVSVAEKLAVAIRNADLYARVRETGERLNNLVRSALDGIIIVDLNGRITGWNPAAERIYGYAEEEVLGKRIVEIFPDTPAEDRRIWGRVKADQPVPPHEVTRKRKDGSSVDVSVTFSTIKDRNGRVVGFSGINRDVTERKRAEALLQQQSAAMSSATDGMAILDREGVYTYVNEAHARIYGYDNPQDLIGQTWKVLYGGAELKRFEKEIMPRFFREGRWRGEAVGKKRDGGAFPQEVSLTKLEGRGIICVCRDISERKQAEKLLLRSEKLAAIGRLTAGAAHEILNPANIIGIQSQLLERNPNDLDSVLRFAASITQNIKRIAKICESLRRFSRDGESAVTRFPVGELIGEVVSMVEHEARVDNVTLSVLLPKKEILLDADRDQLLQVFLNLISNARDAMPEGGNVTIKAQRLQKRSRPWVRISVKDEGVGMSQEEVSKIFDPFFTTKAPDKGTGLGLSIVHGIVEDHGGHIGVQTRPGGGTTFHVDLPAGR